MAPPSTAIFTGEVVKPSFIHFSDFVDGVDGGKAKVALGGWFKQSVLWKRSLRGTPDYTDYKW